MIIYNVTSNIQKQVAQQWLDWMQNKHIPEILATAKFSKAVLVRVLVPDEQDDVTYAAQFTTSNRETLQKYYTHDAPKFRSESVTLFGDKVLTFRTELEVIEEFYVNSN